jgi:hypothetical protein
MNRSTALLGAVLFILGVLVGTILPTRRVSAQTMPQGQNDWIIQPAKDRSNFDAYFFNTRTGEAFRVDQASKTPVKLKP